MDWIILFVMCTILIAIAISYWYLKQHKDLKNYTMLTWHEPSKNHLSNTIDNSLYFSRLNDLDVKARGASSVDDYIQKYKANIQKFSKHEQKHINKLVDVANIKIEPYKNIKTLPWCIAKFSHVENNFPHTHGDIIFIPDGFLSMPFDDQVEVLIHEKVHVFQRIFTIETNKLLDMIGFKPYGPQSSIKNIRTNPDTNSFLYKLNDTVQAQLYSTDNPSSIIESSVVVIHGDKQWDIPSTIKQADHPYEIMACTVSQLIMNRSSVGDHSMYGKTMSWMNMFL